MLRSKKLKNHLYTITYSFEATLTVQTNTQVYQSATFFFRCRITKVKPISKLAPTKIINMFPRQHFNFKLFFPLNFATDQNVFRQQCLSEFQNSNVGGKQIVNRVSARFENNFNFSLYCTSKQVPTYMYHLEYHTWCHFCA